MANQQSCLNSERSATTNTPERAVDTQKDVRRPRWAYEAPGTWDEPELHMEAPERKAQVTTQVFHLAFDLDSRYYLWWVLLCTSQAAWLLATTLGPWEGKKETKTHRKK